ncbi:MAG: TSUP family transporter [Cyclobacteriaceae bacterium]
MLTELSPFLFFCIALFYSSVGFGGGSSYLAILSLITSDFYEIRSSALILNITVVSINIIMSVRNNVFNWKLFWPFLILSIPLAYLGATMKLSTHVFFILLGSLLIFSGLSLISRFLKTKASNRKLRLRTKLSIGGSLGFLAGISGIGGGIFLSPFLNMISWANTRTIAVLASVFIFFNSISGLIGLRISNTLVVNLPLLLKLVCAVFLGGVVGSFFSTKYLKRNHIGMLTAVLVIYVGIRLLLLHGFNVRI